MPILDLNRFKRIYGFVRFKPSLQKGVTAVLAEAGEIIFTNSDSETHLFTTSFGSAPFVTATAFDSAGNEDANINVFVTAISTSSVTIKTSATFTGKIHFQAILNT